MKNNNIPCENEENLTTMDLIGNVFSLIEAAHEQDTNKAKEGLERCVDNEADCTGCPYEDVEACHGKLMEDALRLIGELEMENKILAMVIAKNNMQLMEDLNDENA